MKHFHGILCIITALASAYIMFFKKDLIEINPGDLNLILGFGVLLISIIFMSFMLYEEKQEELEKIKRESIKHIDRLLYK
jgi:uncharacterized protein YpmB